VPVLYTVLDRFERRMPEDDDDGAPEPAHG
jgi:hypothetical protein